MKAILNLKKFVILQIRLHFELGTLKQLKGKGLDKFNKIKDKKYIKLLKDVVAVNEDALNKSTDIPNLLMHLAQLRKNVPFIRD